MSRKYALLCLLFICGILCLLLLCDNYCPDELRFSRESGFYEEPFELKLSAPFGEKNLLHAGRFCAGRKCFSVYKSHSY